MVSLVPEEATGSASESSDLSIDQKIVKLQQQINRQFAIDDYKGAVSVCEELCALMSAKYDELHDECAGPYYQYATALLELAREENQVLGSEKLQTQTPGEEGEDGPDSTEQGESSESGPCDTDIADTDRSAADTVRSAANTDRSATDAGRSATNDGEDEEEGDDAEDDITSLQIAWEVLELSRIIYVRQDSPESQKKLAKVKIKLGEVSMENEKMDDAITQFTESIEHFVAGGEPPDSREISSTYYMMGLAASLDQKYGQAVQFFSKCSGLMTFQIAKEEESERASLMEMKSEVDKMVADCKDSLRQLEQYRKLIPTQVTAAGCDSSSGGVSSAASTSGGVSSAASTSGGVSSAASSSTALLGATSTTSSTTSSNNGTTSTNIVTPINSVTPSTSSITPTTSSITPGGSATAFISGFGSATSSSGFGSSSSTGPVTNISHLVRKRPVSHPVQPVSQTTPSSSSEISAKLSVKPTVRVSPMVSSSTSPGSVQPNRQNDGQTHRPDNQAAAASTTSTSYISSTNPSSSNPSRSNPSSSNPSNTNPSRSNPSSSNPSSSNPSSSNPSNTNPSSSNPSRSYLSNSNPSSSNPSSSNPSRSYPSNSNPSSSNPSRSNPFSSNPSSSNPSSSNPSRISFTNSSVNNRSMSSMVQSSSEAQPLPSQSVAPCSSFNRQANGVSSTSGLDARLAGSTSGFTELSTTEAATSSEAEGRVSDVRPSNTSRQVATVSSVQRTEEAISSTSDFKRPAEEVEDMSSNEAKRSRQ